DCTGAGDGGGTDRDGEREGRREGRGAGVCAGRAADVRGRQAHAGQGDDRPEVDVRDVEGEAVEVLLQQRDDRANETRQRRARHVVGEVREGGAEGVAGARGGDRFDGAVG